MVSSNRELSPDSTVPPWGRVFTFYSYKGGVGRSMALANVAALLAKWGKRVLIADWDLEAPGLERFFERWLRGSRAATPGILDLIMAKARGDTLSWRTCLLEAQPYSHAPAISIITAGRQTPGYARDVQGLDWSALFTKHDLGTELNRLRNEWATAYDFVLIDSRTGINDVGGICTVLLPDVVVLLFTTSEQSVDGVVEVMDRARALHKDLPVERGRLLAVPLPSRDESRRFKDEAERWRKTFADRMRQYYADWAPRNVSAEEIVNRLYIPYAGEFSFGEQVPVVDYESQLGDPASLSYAYARLATLIEERLDWDAVVRGGEAGDVEDVRAKLAAATYRQKRSRQFTAAAVTAAVVVTGVVATCVARTGLLGFP